MKGYIGIDLGGTNLRGAVLFHQSGEVSSLISIPTISREGHEAVIGRMANLIERIISSSGINRNDVQGVGIGAPGTVDMQDGVVKFLTNFPGNWPNVPLCARIKELTGFPTFLINDVRAITLGEHTYGAGKGAETMICLAIGTGVGGGVIINNRLHLGPGGSAGEIGHSTVDINGVRCGCGNYGCLETMASAPAIAGQGIKAVIQGLKTQIADLVDCDLNRITAEVVYRAAMNGDIIAREIYDRAGFYIGLALANVVMVLDPTRIVIGGGVARSGDLIIEPIRRTIRERIQIMPITHLEVVQAKLADNGGIIGSAVWALKQIEKV